MGSYESRLEHRAAHALKRLVYALNKLVKLFIILIQYIDEGMDEGVFTTRLHCGQILIVSPLDA